MSAHDQRRSREPPSGVHPRRGHLRCRLAGGDEMNRLGLQSRPQRVVSECARQRTIGARGVQAGADDSDQILTNAGDGQDQWAFCGSDQADSFVTTSNSRRSSATT